MSKLSNEITSKEFRRAIKRNPNLRYIELNTSTRMVNRLRGTGQLQVTLQQIQLTGGKALNAEIAAWIEEQLIMIPKPHDIGVIVGFNRDVEENEAGYRVYMVVMSEPMT